MKQTAAEQEGIRSLSETHIVGLHSESQGVRDTSRACLLQIYPAGVHAEMIRLDKRLTLIGRDLICDVALDDTAVSRSHAAIDCEDSGYFVSDLGSRNGTFVDDQRLLDRRRLCGGELIRIGETILKFMSASDEETQYHTAVHELITRDTLTNTFNRGFLMSSLGKMLPRCRRSGSDLALIVIDIDHFKAVNDTFGHMVGDEVLRIFSERLRGALRTSDVLCRLGGEEFVVIAELSSLQDAMRIAERLRLAVSCQPFPTQSGPIQITCSLGVASLSKESVTTVEELLRAADQQLYLAKNDGRNCVKSELDQDFAKDK